MLRIIYAMDYLHYAMDHLRYGLFTLRIIYNIDFLFSLSQEYVLPKTLLSGRYIIFSHTRISSVLPSYFSHVHF